MYSRSYTYSRTLFLIFFLSTFTQIDATIIQTVIPEAHTFNSPSLQADHNSLSSQSTRAIIPYQPTHQPGHLCPRQFSNPKFTIYNWQSIAPISTTATHAILTLYNRVLAYLTKLDHNTWYSNDTALHFTYGSLELSIHITSSSALAETIKYESMRRVGLAISPGELIAYDMARMVQAALRGFIGFCKMVFKVGGLLVGISVLTMALGGEREAELVASNVIT